MQERIKILDLVAQGKLSAEQADLLLDALESQTQPKVDGKAAWDRATAEIKSFGSQMSSVLAQSMTELRRGLETNLTNLSFGDHIAISLEREFAEETRSIRLDSVNGRIRVERWSRPYVRMYVQADVRAEDQDKAREVLEQAVQVTETDDQASIRVLNRWDGARVHGGRIDLYIPESLTELSLQTRNGAIFVDHATVDLLKLETLNGQIHLEHITAHELHASTQNGSIQLNDSIQDITQEVYAESKNGSVTVRGLPTTIPVRGQAKSLAGVVQVSHPAFIAQYENNHRKNACTFELKDALEEVDKNISVYLETKNGKISVQ